MRRAEARPVGRDGATTFEYRMQEKRSVGFTGTRYGMTQQQQLSVHQLMCGLGPIGSISTAHHGDCIGADAHFHGCARRLGLHIVGHLPVDERHRAFCDFDETRAPLKHMQRNKQIVLAADIVIATPFEAEEQAHGGTWRTIAMTRKAKKPLLLVWPDGRVQVERWP